LFNEPDRDFALPAAPQLPAGLRRLVPSAQGYRCWRLRSPARFSSSHPGIGRRELTDFVGEIPHKFLSSL
jgi:hypothetical protein